MRPLTEQQGLNLAATRLAAALFSYLSPPVCTQLSPHSLLCVITTLLRVLLFYLPHVPSSRCLDAC